MFNGFPRSAAQASEGPPGFLDHAWRALRAEIRKQGAVVECEAYAVTPIGDPADRLFRLLTRASGPLDWTWEGSTAYQLRDPDDPTDRVWSGRLVQVDEDAGEFYVGPVAGRVRKGPFRVRPFGFLDALQTLFRQAYARPETAQDLARALWLAQGHPAAAEAWSILWGPPGTGKTYTIGRRVAQAVADDPEARVLVVSTTNRATDAVALQIADAFADRGLPLSIARRVGTGASLGRFEAAGAAELVADTELAHRRALQRLVDQMGQTNDPATRARLAVRVDSARQALRDAVGALLDPRRRVVVCTAFHALSRVVDPWVTALRDAGRAPFTTVVLDEAGLTNRMVTAAIAQLTARRVWLVGDPQQLAPIARMARVLPSLEARWLARSGLSHLDPAAPVPDNVEVLTVQYRMGPTIRTVVSRYAYHDRLTDAPCVLDRAFAADRTLLSQPRAIWYVLDEDTGGRLADIRAERGPGHHSWIRRRTLAVIDKLLRAHPALAQHRTLVMTPFRAQARALGRALADRGLLAWEACTVHAQQGAEAPVVIFDPVNAGSAAWGAQEWRRLVNVALSRAQHQIVVLASRLEMQEPYLRPLAETLAPRVLERDGSTWRYRTVPGLRSRTQSPPPAAAPSLGAQFASRRTLTPVLSHAQQRLCNARLDGKPRLVRGVAGSGKTWVLAHWLARTIQPPDFVGRAFVVFANRSLDGVLNDLIARAWAALEPDVPLPTERYAVVHVRDVLDGLLREEGLPPVEGYDFDAAAVRYLEQAPDWAHRPRCVALFVDEAQDVGPQTLRLLAGLVRPVTARARHRPTYVFYDNAQNLYARGTPRWSELGIDIKGRSTVLEESFRGTRPLAEFALNTLARLYDLHRDPDHRELLRRGLVTTESRGSRPYLRVHFNGSDGPRPLVACFDDRDAEFDALARQIEVWIGEEGVAPGDIRVIANGRSMRQALVDRLASHISPFGVFVEGQARRTLSTDERTLVVTTAHSFKGHEAEIVAVAAADRFVARSADPPEILSQALYVALTRARSVLYVSATEPAGSGSPVDHRRAMIVRALRDTDVDLNSPAVVTSTDRRALERLPPEHHAWFRALAATSRIELDPIVDAHGRPVAHPAFTLVHDSQRRACFVVAPSPTVVADLEDQGVGLLALGDPDVGTSSLA